MNIKNKILLAEDEKELAKSIIDAHRGKINAYINNEDMMCFRILI